MHGALCDSEIATPRGHFFYSPVLILILLNVFDTLYPLEWIWDQDPSILHEPTFINEKGDYVFLWPIPFRSKCPQVTAHPCLSVQHDSRGRVRGVIHLRVIPVWHQLPAIVRPVHVRHHHAAGEFFARLIGLRFLLFREVSIKFVINSEAMPQTIVELPLQRIFVTLMQDPAPETREVTH